VPPLKSSAGTTSNEKKEASNGKKGFLRKGFLNLRPAVLAPSTSLSLPSELALSSTSEDKEVGCEGQRHYPVSTVAYWFQSF
jgi:hypothetical protein